MSFTFPTCLQGFHCNCTAVNTFSVFWHIDSMPQMLLIELKLYWPFRRLSSICHGQLVKMLIHSHFGCIASATQINVYTCLCLLYDVRLSQSRNKYLPLMLKFLPSSRCLRDGCLEKAGMTQRRSASSPEMNRQSQQRLKQTQLRGKRWAEGRTKASFHLCS